MRCFVSFLGALLLVTASAWAQFGTMSLTNKSGGTVAQGAVVVVDTSTNSSFTTTTSERAGGVLGVVNQTTIANNATGKVILYGIVDVTIVGAVSRGDFVITSTTAGSAKSGGSNGSSAFGVALEAGTDASLSVLLKVSGGVSSSEDITVSSITLPDGNGTLVLGTNNDIQFGYDETTDDRLEIDDGTNLLLAIKDEGTTGSLLVTNYLAISGASDLRLQNGSYYVGFKPPALSASQIWTLPTGDGTSGYVLQTNGSGVLSWASQTTVTDEEVEDLAGAMWTGNTETLITLTYQDDDGTVDAVVSSDLHAYSWTNVDGTDLKVGSVTQAYDADLDDLADGSLSVSKVDFGAGTANYVWSSDGSGTESWAAVSGLAQEEVEDFAGAMWTSNTETRVIVTYQDSDGTIDIEVLDDLHYYDWSAVDATDLQVGSITLAWDDDLDDIAALTPTDSNIIVGDGTDWVAESGATARTSLGVVIGTDVQAYDAQLADIAGMTPTDSNIIVGDGTNFVLESGATARTSLGVAIGTDVQAYDAQLADVAGMTPTDSNIIVGDGTNFVLESGATARTSLGLGTIATQAADSVDIDGGAIDGATVGSTTPAAGAFTTLGATDTVTIAADKYINFSTAFDLGYDSTDTALELTDGTTELVTFTDEGTSIVVDVNGTISSTAVALLEKEIISATTPVNVSGKSLLIFDAPSNYSLDQLSSGTAGQIITLINIDTTYTVTLTEAAVEGGFVLPGDADMTLEGDEPGLQFVYTTIDSLNRWVLIGGGTTGGGSTYGYETFTGGQLTAEVTTPATGPFITTYTLSTDPNTAWMVSFGPSADSYAFVNFVLPDNFGGSLWGRFYWTAAAGTADTDTVRLEAQVLDFDPNTGDLGAAGEEETWDDGETDTLLGVDYIHQTSWIALDANTDLEAGDFLTVRLRRDVSDDTGVITCRVTCFELRWSL